MYLHLTKPLLLLATFAGLFFLWAGFASAQTITLDPPAPVCITSAGVTGPQITLTWTDTFQGANPTFEIFRMIPGETAYTQVGSTNQNNFVDTVANGIVSDKAYRYQIKGDKGGSGPIFSNEGDVAAQYCEPILSPDPPSCAADGPHIILNWSSITGSLNKYEIYRGITKIGETTGTTFDDGPNIEGGVSYDYKIRAIWQDATFRDSVVNPVTALYCAPTLTASASCETGGPPGGPRVDLSWNGLLGVNSYEIWRKAQSETVFTKINPAPIPPGTTVYVDFLVDSLNSSYQNGGNAEYFVKAVWAGTDKDSTPPQVITIPRCAPYLTVDTNCQDFSFDLSWTRTKDATFYNIYRDGSFLTQVSSAQDSYPDFMDLILCPGEVCSYTYRVEAAVSGNPNMSSSDITKSIDCATVVPPDPPPHMEQPIPYCDAGDSKISLGTSIGDPGWSASNNTFNYSVFRNSVEEAIRIARWYIDSNVQSGIDYAYYIVANGEGGTTTLSDNSYTVTSVSCIPPSVPNITSLAASCSAGNPQVDIFWDATTNTESYDILRGTVSGSLSVVKTFDVKPLPTSWQDTGVSASITYYYRVVANGPQGVAPTSSSELSVATGSCAPTIPVLTLSTACVSGSAEVTLNWATDHANTDHYKLERQDVGGGNLVAFPNQFPLTTSFIDTTTALSKAYEYRVTAVGPTGLKSTQGWKPITSDSCLPTVPALTLTPQCNVNDAEIVLDWTTDEKNTSSYEIFRLDYDSANPIATISSPAIKTWTDTGTIMPIAYNTSYSYKVEAVGSTPAFRSTEGYKTITSLDCSPPGPFTLSVDNPPMCAGGGSYLRADLSWTASSNANTYELRSTDIIAAQTTLIHSTSSPASYTDIGLGKALNFDGNNDYVNLGGSASLEPSNAITVTAWVRKSAFNGVLEVIVGGDSKDMTGYNLFIENLQLKFRFNKDHAKVVAVDFTPYLDNTWHFVSATKSLTASNLYIDGVLRDTTSYGSTAMMQSADDLYIGNEPARSYYFLGAIDEVLIYNRVLSLAEIQDLYTGNNPVSDSGLQGRWHMDEDSTAQTVSDSSNNGNDGTLQGGAAWVDSGMKYETAYNWQAEAFGYGSTFATPNPTANHTTPMCVPTKPGVVLSAYCNLNTGVPNIDISWSYSINTANYEIYREEGAIDPLIGTVAQSVDPAIRIVTDDNGGIGLLPLTTYSYYVLSKSVAALPDGVSDTISVTTPNCTPPTKPIITDLHFQCSGSFPEASLTWTDSLFTDYYTVYRGITPLSPNITDTGAAAYTFIDTGIAVDTGYTYTVRAFGPGGWVDSDPASLAAGNFCTPSTPSITSLLSSCQSQSRINTVSWADATTFNSTSYKVFRGGSEVKNITTSDPEFGTRTWGDNLGSGPVASFDYQVQALGPAGSSALSSIKSVQTFSCGVKPSTPSNLSANLSCIAGVPEVELTWDPSVDAYSYRIYKGQDQNAPALTYNTRISPETDRGSHALHFDGAGATGGYVSVSNPVALTGNQYTLAAWVYPENIAGDGDSGIISKNQGVNVEPYHLGIGGSGSINARVNGSGACCHLDTAAGTVVNNLWQHLVARYDGSTLTAYLNGGKKGSINISSDVNASAADLVFGRRADDRRFTGIIDDVRVYNRALSPSEILDLANGTYENQAGLIGMWHFDEGSGGTVEDQSGNGKTGTLVNGVTWKVLSSTDDSFDSGPLVNGQDYTYYVSAFGADMESDPSNSVSVSANCSPITPNLTATPQCVSGDSQFLLSWGADSNTDYWDIYKQRESDGFVFLNRVFPPNTSYSDSDVQSGTHYDYYITAVGFATSAVSNLDGGTALSCANPPAKPAFINATPEPVCFGTSSRIKLEWTPDGTGNTLSFNVRRNNVTLGETGFNIREPGLPANDTDYYDLVTANDDYEYKIEAVGSGTNNIALSDPSSVVTALDCANLPPSPPDLSLNIIASTGDQVSVSLTWTNDGLADDYRVFRSDDGGSTFNQVAYLAESTNYSYSDPTVSYVDNAVTDGGTYIYRVYAYNNSASFDSADPLKVFNASDEPEGGIASNDLSVPVPIAVPGAFTAQGQWVGMVVGPFRVTWNTAATTANGGCVIYEVVKDDNSGFSSPTSVCSDITESSPDCRLVPGPDPLECDDATPTLLERFYRVEAQNVGGSSYSNTVELTPPLPKYKEIAP